MATELRAQVLSEAHLLSVVPGFDEDLATDLAERFTTKRDQSKADEAGSDLLPRLRRAGVLTGGPLVWRIADPLRARLQSEVKEQDQQLFLDVIGVFTEYARNGLGSKLEAYYGPMAGVQVAVAESVLPSAPRRFDPVVDAVLHSTDAGRVGDSLAAARLIKAAPETDDSTRQAEFLEGYFSWLEGDTDDARRHFEVVLASAPQDKAKAISAHLVAVHNERQGRLPEALQSARLAVSILRALNDASGLAMTLTTLGRVESKIYTNAQIAASEDNKNDVSAESIVDLPTGLPTLEEAVRISSQVGSRTHWTALGNLASVLAMMGAVDQAISASEEAHELIPANDDDYLYNLTQLASLYRQVGRLHEAADVLEQAFERAVRPSQLLDVAKALNVLASFELQLGSVKPALEHARKSVEIGNQLHNLFHLSHALVTLALVALRSQRYQEALQSAEQARRVGLQVSNSITIRKAEEIIDMLRTQH